MRKVARFLTILIFMDLLFIVTGQLPITITSMILDGILNLATFNLSAFFTDLIGDFTSLTSSLIGIAALLVAVGSAVTSGFLVSLTDTKLFVPIAITLSLLAGDFVAIYIYLASYNQVLATLIMAPIILIYVFTVVEWLKGVG